MSLIAIWPVSARYDAQNETDGWEGRYQLYNVVPFPDARGRFHRSKARTAFVSFATHLTTHGRTLLVPRPWRYTSNYCLFDRRRCCSDSHGLWYLRRQKSSRPLTWRSRSTAVSHSLFARRRTMRSPPLLYSRSARCVWRKVGATVEVVCVGRVKVEKVDAEGRSLVGTKVLPLRDSELKGVVVHAADEDLVDAVSAAAAGTRCLLEKLEEDLYDEECEAEDDAEECLPKKWPAVHDAFRGVVVPTTTPSNAILSSKGFGGGPQQGEQLKEGEEEAEEERAAARALELAAERLTEELCSIDLDLPPLDSLERRQIEGLSSGAPASLCERLERLTPSRRNKQLLTLRPPPPKPRRVSHSSRRRRDTRRPRRRRRSSASSYSSSSSNFEQAGGAPARRPRPRTRGWLAPLARVVPLCARKTPVDLHRRAPDAASAMCSSHRRDLRVGNGGEACL